MLNRIFIVLVSSIFLISCDDDLKPSDNTIFDAATLLDNIVDHHLLPELDGFEENVNDLVISKNRFIETPSNENLAALRENYFRAYVSFQAVGKYESDVSRNNNYYLNLNAHPLDLENITAFILDQENQNFSSILNQDRQGFPALDYLLYGLADSDDEVIAFFTGADGDDYKGFLSKVTDRIDSLTKEVNNDWETNLAAIVKSDVQFIDPIFNNYLEYFEKRVRSSKIDFPSGKFDGTPSPESIESLFDPENSKTLLVEAFNNIELFYLGTENTTSSWSQVLIDLEEDGLDAKIKLAFLEAKNAINGLDDNLKLQVETDNAQLLAARDEIQDVVRLLKADLVSKLGISITFIDNDGD